MFILQTWITNNTDRPFYVRKEFIITKNVQSGVAKVCGLGQFVFHMNGKKVGDHELDPGWTDYSKLVEYVSFDVTKYLHLGINVLGAEVGNGWFIKTDEHYTFAFPPFMPPNPNPYKPYGRSLVFAIELTLTYQDGTCDVITADDSFMVKEHPVVMSNVYGSETIDNRLLQKGWCEEGFDVSSWKRASIVSKQDAPGADQMEQFHPPVKVIRTYDAMYKGTVGGRAIYDFGQNMSGLLSLEAKGKRGDLIRIYPAEKLKEDGDVDQVAKGWVTLDSCITLILGEDDAWEAFRMTFTYFAGRYIAVEISAENDVSIRNLKADAVSSAFETDGSFSCDDIRYEQIYSIVEKAVEANMTSGVHTDCPTIERFAWQEPNHLMAPAIMYMKNGKKLWEKFLLDMRLAQHTKEDYFLDLEGKPFYPGDGLMPSQCPCYIPNVLPVPGTGSFYDIIAWGSTCILGTYWHYHFYGDKKIIEDNYDAGMRYLNHLKTKVTPEGFINHGLGDWGNPTAEYARENIETAFLYADTKTLCYFAGILGKEEDERALEAYAEDIKKNYNEKLMTKHPETGCWCYRVYNHEEFFMTQAAEALPLYWGLVPKDKEADVAAAFRETLLKEGAFVSGEVGLPYVIQTARKYDMNDLISRFILREKHPSYYAFVLDGETTLGEYWETNPRSHCHDMMGHIVEWYYNGIAGIEATSPGFASVKITPYLPQSMHSFDCRYHSVSGEIGVSVQEKEGAITLQVKIPEGLPCEIDTVYLKRRGNVSVVQNKRPV